MRFRSPVAVSRVRWARLAVFLALITGAIGLSGCGKTKKIFKPSAADQRRLGEEAAREVERQYRLVGGAPQARVQNVGQRLVNALDPQERERWGFRFQVVDSKEVNAFALPGGNTYIFTGLLNRIETDDELAGVMAHELAHVYQEHWAEQAAAQQERNAGLAIVLGATKAGDAWYNAAGVVSSLVDLRYSRKDEDESDEMGLYNMVAAGFNPRGMVELFRTLQEASGSGGGPEFLRSHPGTADRIRKTEERIANLKKP